MSFLSSTTSSSSSSSCSRASAFIVPSTFTVPSISTSSNSHSFNLLARHGEKRMRVVRYVKAKPQASNGDDDSNDNDSNDNDSNDKDNNDNNDTQKQNPKSNNKKNNKNNKNSTNKKNNKNNTNNNNNNNKKKKQPPKNNKNIINLLSNPYEAGVQLRQTFDRTIGSINKKPLTPQQKSIYYLDDRFLESKSDTSGSSSGIGGGNSKNGNDLPSDNALAFVERKNLFSGIDDLDLLFEDNDYIPEVLVIGATSAIGKLVVKRLLLSKKFKVRVLVRDLYSKTLNMLGTGVTYCQGELYNMESLEYALTDVDKIVFCESPPKQDEFDYQLKFNQFVKETLTTAEMIEGNANNTNNTSTNTIEEECNEEEDEECEIQQMSEIMEMKAKIAKEVDWIGMQNVLRAYQNVRHADYGTSQAAKRSLFKFQKREEDFDLFSIHFDDDDDDDIVDEDIVDDDTVDEDNDNNKNNNKQSGGIDGYKEYNKYGSNAKDDYYDQDYDYDNMDEYDNYGDDYQKMNDAYSNTGMDTSNKQKISAPSIVSSLKTTAMKTQVNWMKNKFNHGVFVGKLPKATSSKTNAGAAATNRQGGAEVSIISSRLRSREDPDKGIDLSNGFAGFVCRLCSDGQNYEAFLRTSEYELNGIEYVCKFQAKSKKQSSRRNGGGNGKNNRSINKFATVRLPFSKFVPVVRRQRLRKGKEDVHTQSESRLKLFDGNDVKQIGFRIKSVDNMDINQSKGNNVQIKKGSNNNWISFYLSLSYIKVYRSQPEPEFIYLSDARLGDVHDDMVNHNMKQVVISGKDDTKSQNDLGDIDDGGTTIFDEEEAMRVITNKNDRSGEELYYKYCGEEMLKHSGLSYSIIRIPDLNELNSGEFSTLKLKQSNDNLTAVSRAEVAAVCESALLDPNARNTCFYLTKARPGDEAIQYDPNISRQFLSLDPET